MKNLRRILVGGAMLCALAMQWGNVLGQQASPAAEENSVTAVDILLEPDATMIQHAEAVNARLLKVFPKGFSLDATHHPQITMLQRFVRTADLDKLYAAAEKVFANSKVTELKLKAFKYYYIPDKSLGLSGIVVKPTPEMLKIEQDLIEAVAPFTVKTGTSAAFVTTPDDPVIKPFSESPENRPLSDASSATAIASLVPPFSTAAI